MKARINLKQTMLGTVVLLAAFSFGSCNKDDDNPQPVYAISGNASGSQVVPSVAGSGTGNLTGTYDPNTMQMNYTTTWNGLTGAPTTGGFYTGASGASGTSLGTPWTFGGTSTGTGTYTGTMTLTSDQASQLTSGNMYYSYGTTANPSGEVRGQMTATR